MKTTFLYLSLLAAFVLWSTDGALGQRACRAIGQLPSLSAPASIASPASNPPLASGSYTVGTGGTFPTIDSAFNRLANGILGPVTFLLTDTLYIATDANLGTIPLVGPIVGTSPVNRITLRPADGKKVTIRGDGPGVLQFRNVSYFTIDGISLQGATSLKVQSLYSLARVWNDGADFIGNCDFIRIQNLTASSGDVTDRVSAAVALYATSAGSPDSGVISGINVLSGSMGIYLGSDSTGTRRPSGNVIRNCHVGSPTDSLIAWGIQDENANGTIIENNLVEGIRYTLASGEMRYQIGINTYRCNGTIIRNNIIHNLRNTANNVNCQAILASGESAGSGNFAWMYNNMVYDITNGFNGGVLLSGIRAFNNSNMHIDYNSVVLANAGDYSAGLGSFGIRADDNCGVVITRNNIIVNTRNDTPGSIALWLPNQNGSDCNDLLVAAISSANLAHLGVNYKGLADWQTIGKDVHSVSVMPVFMSPHLSIDSVHASPACDSLCKHGMPIDGITTDLFGRLRHATTPDIGADEFHATGVSVGDDPVRGLPASFVLHQNYPNPFNPSTVISFEVPVESHVRLTVFDMLGREVAVLVNEGTEAGMHSVTFDGSHFASGVYFYRLHAGGFVSTMKFVLVR